MTSGFWGTSGQGSGNTTQNPAGYANAARSVAIATGSLAGITQGRDRGCRSGDASPELMACEFAMKP